MTEMNDNQPVADSKVSTELDKPEKPTYDVEYLEQYGLKAAGFWTRFWAYLIDLVVIFSIGRLFVYPVFRLAGWNLDKSDWYAPIAIISALIFYGYFVLMTKFFKQTVGKMILGIHVISLKNTELKWSDILFREWIGRFISTTILILYFVVGFTPKKQGVHDFFADTTVVHDNVYDKTVKKIYTKRENVSELQEPTTF